MMFQFKTKATSIKFENIFGDVITGTLQYRVLFHDVETFFPFKNTTNHILNSSITHTDIHVI